MLGRIGISFLPSRVKKQYLSNIINMSEQPEISEGEIIEGNLAFLRCLLKKM